MKSIFILFYYYFNNYRIWTEYIVIFLRAMSTISKEMYFKSYMLMPSAE